MAKRNEMIPISFRLPQNALDKLKKHFEYTKWIQMVVLESLGHCPCCGNKYKEASKEVVK